jgi:hypothetical protein
MLPGKYARSALKTGLQMEKILGINPFKFGLLGATDSHTSLATTRENNNFGKVSVMEPSSERFKGQIVPDPDGANLDRVQIIKGWLDGKGEQQERAYTSPVWYTP